MSEQRAERDGDGVEEDETPDSIDVQPEDPNRPGTESPDPIE